MNESASSEEKGIIGEIQEDNLPVIYKLVNEMPNKDVRDKFNWLTVISWKYDGSQRNGMPAISDNKQMLDLEHAIEEISEKNISLHAYSRTGNNLKELVYYIHSRDEFMDAFNKGLANHPRYPLDIKFYEDNDWKDFEVILNIFNKPK